MDVLGALSQLVDFVFKACTWYLATSPDAEKELNDIEVALGISVPTPPTSEPQPTGTQPTAREISAARAAQYKGG